MKTALLIDDDRDSRGSLAVYLRAAGWEVLEAEDGENGISLALARAPDLVLCDLLMPRCNGFQVCRTLRKEKEKLSHTRIIVTTSSGYATDRLNALEAGAHEYLVKPIIPDEFLQLLESMDRDGPRSRDPITERFTTRRPAVPGGDTAVFSRPTRVKFWGVRGSIPTPGLSTAFYGGNTSCVEIRADGELIILDAGTGIRVLGSSLMSEFPDTSISCTLLISHTHWDHIQGFPFFAPAYNPRNSVRIIGYEGAAAGLKAVLSSQMESPYFPVGWKQIPGHIQIEEMKDLKFSIGAVEVEAAFMNHPGICMGYRINTSSGSVAYLPDNEPFQRYKYHAGAANMVPGAEVLDYARKQDDKLVQFIRGVDVLIIDSQYDAEEYQTRIGWGHGCLDDVVALALQANVKRLCLFHHDPGHDDEKVSRMVAWAREFVAALGEDLIVEASREGLEITVERSKSPFQGKA